MILHNSTKSSVYKSHNFVVSEQAAANRKIETLKEENTRQSQGELMNI